MSDAAVTTHDLDRGMSALRGEMHAMRGELRGEMHAMRDELRGEMHAMRDELRGEMHVMRDELRGEMHVMRDELRGEMHAMGGALRGEIHELRSEIHVMKTDLIREIGAATSHVANVMIEHIQSLVAVVEEKYQDLPPAHAKLRDDFDAHAADLRLHAPSPTAAPKRTRRPRSR